MGIPMGCLKTVLNYVKMLFGRFRTPTGWFKAVPMPMSNTCVATLAWCDLTTMGKSVPFPGQLLSVAADSRSAAGDPGQKLSEFWWPDWQPIS
jgi:hypothetical protein